jgi:hypothetical protein
LSSTRLTPLLLFALLLLSLVASLFPQMPDDPTPAVRQTWLAAVKLRYGPAATLWQRLGLFDLYRSPLFLALLVMLLLNTFACTLQRIFSLYRSLARAPAIIQPPTFYQHAATAIEWPVAHRDGAVDTAQQHLARRRYRVYVDHEAHCAYLYAERGKWGRLGSPVGHAAALVFFLALLVSPALSWHEPSVNLLPGQGHVLSRRPDLTLVSETDEKETRLVILTEDGSATMRTARLDRGISYRGLGFHLRGIGPAIQVTTPEDTFDLIFVGDQVQEVALPGANTLLRLVPQAGATAIFVEALDAAGELLGSGTVTDGQQIDLRGMTITFLLQQYTAWQISRDPTFWPAIVALSVFLIATLVSLSMPRRRLWLRIDPQSARMVGVGDFGTSFERLVEVLSKACRAAGADSDG